MMDILKRIDFVQQFANEYADGSWSIDVVKWKHHVTPEFIEDIRQYIVSLQLKLMHEQTAQAKPYAYLWEADGTCKSVKGEIQISSNTGPCYGWKVTPLYLASGAAQEPKYWVPPERDDEFHHKHSTVTAYREPMEGWQPVYLASGAAPKGVHITHTPEQAAPVGCVGKYPLCPCQDGDACHYEGKDALPIPAHATTKGEEA